MNFCSSIYLSISIVIFDFLADIEYYGVYEPNIPGAMLSLCIFKPLEYLVEVMIDCLGKLSINQQKF